MTGFRVQVSYVRYAGRGTIFTAVPIGADRVASAPLIIRIPERVLGSQIAVTGDLWALRGEWEDYRGYKQVRATEATLVRPHGQNMIATISGPRFPGIGTVKARALWERFGSTLAGVLDRGDTTALSEVISLTAAQTLVERWQHLSPAEVVEWLDANRFPIRLGQRIVEFYGPTALAKIKSDPYRLLAFGERWSRIDQIARARMGIGRDDPRREHAAVCQVLFAAWDKEACTALERSDIQERVRKRLGGSRGQAERAVAGETGGGFLRDPRTGLYQSRGAWLLEQYVARRLRQMASSADLPQQRDAFILHPAEYGTRQKELIKATLAQWQQQHHVLGEDQEAAVALALENTFTVISGGAGVGKTTVLKALYSGFDALGTEVVQMALSGRASKRMRDATGRKALTIAGFLRENSRSSVAQGIADPDVPDTKSYVVDEASMLDVATLYRILRRIGPGGRLVLVGDDMQLPPIGAGLTFHLMCGPEATLPRMHLSRVYRQEGSTGIPVISQAVRDGQWPELPLYTGAGVGVSVLPCGEADAAEAIQRVYEELVSAEGLEDEVQILATTRGERRETPSTVVAINKSLFTRRLMGRRPVIFPDGLSPFSEGCPIMFTENDWDRSIFNGSLGMIVDAFDQPMVQRGEDDADLVPWETAVYNERHGSTISEDEVLVCRAEFEGKTHLLTQGDLNRRVERAFAVTIHKAQGSQWNRVIIPVSPSRLLDRTLVYTAITRGVRQVVLLGDIGAAAAAVSAPPSALSRVVALQI